MLSLKVSTLPMPGMESLRSSLLTPSLPSSFASASKSESGATSNDSRAQWLRSACSSWIESSPVFDARNARFFSRSASTRPATSVQ